MSRVFEPKPDSPQRVPIHVRARAIDDETLRQLVRVASQRYVVEHVAAMADAHVSEGISVGTVFATENAIVPRALGNDLGCGMSATRIGADASDVQRPTLERIVADLGRIIPTGDATHRGGHGAPVPDALLAPPLSTRSLERTRDALAGKHLGSLGGGNHFIEIDRDAEGALWLLVHSGSRGLGAAIATHHSQAARAAASRSASPLPALDTRDDAGAAYFADVTWALDFARANRRLLVQRALGVIADHVGAIDPAEVLDLHHNFVARETWFGRDLLVHRKGAVAASVDAQALIPGSMGTASYIVRGLGSEASFGSCSHGAGRVMSRREARERISVPALERAMSRVVYSEHAGRSLVEEAPGAYRDVLRVLEDQSDLVTGRVRLEPLAVLKG